MGLVVVVFLMVDCFGGDMLYLLCEERALDT